MKERAGQQVVATPYGRRAAIALHGRLRAIKDGDPLAPATIVVPSHHAGISLRRLLGSGELGPISPNTQGVVGLTITTVARLGETLGAPTLTAAGLRPATTAVLAATVAGILRQAPGIFAPVARHTATVEALVAAHRDLGTCTPDELDRLAAAGSRPADVVRIHRLVRDALAGRFYELADLLRHATDNAPTSPVIADLGHLILYLPQCLSTAEARLLTTLAKQTGLDVIVGLTGLPDADAEVIRSLGLLGIEEPAAPPDPLRRATAVIDASDAEEECRSAIDAVVAALRGEHGPQTAPERIAVLYPSEAPYARQLRALLDDAGIEWNGQRVDPVIESVVGRFLTSLLRLGQRGWRRGDVMRLIAEAPVRHATDDGPRASTATTRSRVPVGRWERLSRDAGLTGGASTWQESLTAHAAASRATAEHERASATPREWLAERHERTAADADALRGFVAGLISTVATIGAAPTWTVLAAAIRTAIHDLLGGAVDRWPPDAQQAAERVDLAVRRLAVLDDVDGAANPTATTAADILERDLADDLGRHGTFGRGVLVGPHSLAVGLDLDLVVVLGLSEGVAPTPTRDDPLLHDDERDVLAGSLPLRRDRSHRQLRQVAAAFASSDMARVAIRPRGDLRRSADRHPSRWLELFDGVNGTHIASYAHRLATTPFPSAPGDYRLARLRRDNPAEDLPAHPLVVADTALARATQAATARRGGAFSRFDGNLTAMTDALPRLDEAPTSASRLEAWARCPFHYFMRYVLGVEPVEQPEDRLDLSALDKGTLIHDVLELWLAEQIDAGTVPASDEPWRRTQRDRLLELAEAECEDYVERGLTGHPTLWAHTRSRVLADLERFLDSDDGLRRDRRSTPAAVELAFGPGEDHEPPPIVLGDGTELRTRGRIDRIDRREGGGLQILDYKTGRAMTANALVDDPVRAGRSLQLSLYARAVEGWAGHDGGPVTSGYWYISRKGKFVTRELDVTPEVIARQEEVLEVIADGLHGGIFVANPDRTTTPWVSCTSCDPDGLGTSELGARFQRLAARVPELARYVQMVEPELLGEDDDG